MHKKDYLGSGSPEVGGPLFLFYLNFTDMTKRIFTKTGLLVLAAVVLSACGGNAAPEASELTPEGLGCLKNGAPVASIPDQCQGLYDKVVKTEEEDMGDTYTLYTFYSGEQKVAEIPAYGQTVDLLIVYSPEVSTPEGMRPGMKVSELLAKPGLKTLYHEGFEYELNGFRCRVDGMKESGMKKLNDAYAQGTELVLAAADFEPDAAVTCIYYVGD